MRFLVVHPTADYSTADVWRGLLAGLRANGHEAVTFELGSHIIMAGAALSEAWAKAGREGDPSQADVTLYAGHAVYLTAVAEQVDAVLVVTAQFWHPDHTIALRRLGYPVGVILTESPYLDEYIAESSMVADAVWTNERASVGFLRRSAVDMARAGFWATRPEHVRYLPAGWNPEQHSPDRAAELARANPTPAHDVVFVGSGYAERIEALEAAHGLGAFDGLDFGLYGDWPYLFPAWVPLPIWRAPSRMATRIGRALAAVGLASPLFRHVRAGVIQNQITTALYNRAAIGLNFFRTSVRYTRDPVARGGRTQAGESAGPRIFELAATGTFTISEHRAEVADMFGPLIPTFRDPGELARLVRDWSGPERAGDREAIGRDLVQVAAKHSWTVRAAQVVEDLARATKDRAAAA